MSDTMFSFFKILFLSWKKKMQKTSKNILFFKNPYFWRFFAFFQLKNKILKKENIVSDIIFYKESESGIRFEEKWFWNFGEGLRMAMVLKFLEYISYIKIKRSGPSSGSLHEKKCILLSVMRVFPLFDSITSTDGPTDGRTKPLIELRVRN